MYQNAEELLKLCGENNKPISEIAIEREIQNSGLERNVLIDKMKNALEIMKNSAAAGLNEPLISLSGMTGGNSNKIRTYVENGKTVCGDTVNTAMARALSTSELNASMGKIVAAPTAGASGILPAALITTAEKFNLSDDVLVSGLFTATAIGQIIAINATISGAEGGCQAECGAGAAMAAAAIVEMMGASPERALSAAGLAIVHVLGLVCDPVGGLVEYPCVFRNASGVINAMISADMALAGVNTLLPFDDVVEAMRNVGRSLNYTLRETGLGGLAATCTGKLLKSKYIDSLYNK